MPSDETDIQSAVLAIYTSQILAVSRAAAVYNVIKLTLQN